MYEDEQYLEKAYHSENGDSLLDESVESGWHNGFPFYPDNWEGSDQGCFNLASLGECSNAKVLEKCKKTCAHLQYHSCLMYLCKAIRLDRDAFNPAFSPNCKKFCKNFYKNDNIYKFGWEIPTKLQEIVFQLW